MQSIVVIVMAALLALVTLVTISRGVGGDTSSDEPEGAQVTAVTEAPVPSPTAPTTTTDPGPSDGSSTTPPSTILTRPIFSGPLLESTQLAVGSDMQPGRYIARSPVGLCYWERLSGPGRLDDDIVVNGLLDSKHVIVDVLGSDVALYSQGCGDWQPYTPPATPETSVTDGDWLVGSDIPPGIYRTQNGIHGQRPCRWERASAFTHAPDEILSHDYPGSEPLSVELHDGERFSTDLCGYWTLTDPTG